VLAKQTRFGKGVGIVIFCYHGLVFAHNWRVTSGLQLQEIYSDNITLAPKGKERSAWVTELSPSAGVIWRAGKSRLNVLYNMQNLYNAHGTGNYRLAHQLLLNGHNVLWPSHLFVDSRASIRQYNINTIRLLGDNIAGTDADISTVSTFGLSPVWQSHFGQFADAYARINVDVVTGGANNGLSDSVTVAESLQLKSGRWFKRANWLLSFDNRQSYRAGEAQDVSFQTATATLRLPVNKHFGLFATVGHSSNVFSNLANTSQNGFFYTAGGRWSPSKHYWLEAGVGNNSYLSLSIAPMQRFNWLTTVRHNTIGLNNGTTWQTAFNYRTRRSTWSLSHTNDTMTVQEILFNTRDDKDSQTLLGNTGRNLTTTPQFTNDVVVRESWDLSANYYTGKSSFALNFFSQDRRYEFAGQEGVTTLNRTVLHEQAVGVGSRWQWQFAGKTSAYIQPQWQHIKQHTVLAKEDASIDRFDVAIGLNRLLTSRLGARLEFRHINQTSNLDNNSYEENRATANLFMRF
jgi:uncharacterized protein (PEP-CTERM system associated)